MNISIFSIIILHDIFLDLALLTEDETGQLSCLFLFFLILSFCSHYE